MRNLRNATQQPSLMDVKILFHICFGALCNRVWFDRVCFGIVPNLSVDMLLGTSLIDGFFHGNFLSEQKFVPWHSHPVAIFVSPEHSKSSNPTTAVVSMLIGGTSQINVKVEEMLALIHMALQAFLRPQTHSRVMVTTSVSCIQTVELGLGEVTRYLKFSAHGVIDVVCHKPSTSKFTTFLQKQCPYPNIWWLRLPRDLRRP